MSDVKCVNSVTFFQNYVTLILWGMFIFVRQVYNLKTNNDK